VLNGGTCAKAFAKEAVHRKNPKLFAKKVQKNLSVFEGFFDFLSFQTLLKSTGANKLELPITQPDYLILNSISFFEKQRAVMEKYSSIHLFPDRDERGKAMTQMALQWSDKFKDQSHFYKQVKDLNEFLIKCHGRQIKPRQSRRLRL